MFLLLLVTDLAAGYPSSVGRVNDFAGLLSHDQAKGLAGEIAAFEARTQHQFAVVTVKSLEGRSIEDYSLGLARSWGVGRAGFDDGVVLLIAPQERKMRIEVGRGLTSRLTDASAQRILDDQLRPRFRAGQMAEGVLTGARAVMTALTPPPVLTPEQREQAAAARVAARKAEAAREVEEQARAKLILLVVVLCGVGVIIAIVVWRYVDRSISLRDEFARVESDCDDCLTRLEQLSRQSRDAVPFLPEVCPDATARRMESLLAEGISELARLRNKVAAITRGFNPWVPSAAQAFDLMHEVWREASSVETRVSAASEALSRGRAARYSALKMADELPRLRERSQELLRDARVGEVSKRRLNEAQAFTVEIRDPATIRDWREYEGRLEPVHKAFARACESAEVDISIFQNAPEESRRLLKDLPALFKKLEQSGSSKARSSLGEARRYYAQATQACQGGGAGLSGAEWLMIFLLLNNSSTSAQAAGAIAASEARAAESARSWQSSSSSSSSSDFGSSSFGGGGFDGGGASSGW